MKGIYKITSPNKRVYIGQSVNIERRFNEYRRLDCKTQPKLYRSLKKHGVENHIFEIITTCEIEDLNRLERYYQEVYNVIIDGLNCSLVNTSFKKQMHSEETKKKISEYAKNRSEETRLKISKAKKGKANPNYGKKISEETKKKISEAKKGSKYLTNKRIIKVSIPNGVIYKNGIYELVKELKISRETIVKLLNGGASKKYAGWTFEYVEK